MFIQLRREADANPAAAAPKITAAPRFDGGAAGSPSPPTFAPSFFHGSLAAAEQLQAALVRPCSCPPQLLRPLNFWQQIHLRFSRAD
nr:unnamed protein product [Digitaria exilis]